MGKHYDIAVIGGGSGGMSAARTPAREGKSVVMFEPRQIGGTCVNRGCVPKKFLVHASRLGKNIDDAHGWGWSAGDKSFDWKGLRETVQSNVRELSGTTRQGLVDCGVDIVDRKVAFTGPNTLRTEDGETFEADQIVIATGSSTLVPGFDGIERAITSDNMFVLDEVPERFAVVGGGYIAVEFASMFHGFGSKVTLFESEDRLVSAVDAEIAEQLEGSFSASGMEVRTGVRVKAIKPSSEDEGRHVLETEEGDSYGPFDKVLVAVGRKPNTDGLGLEAAGVTVSEKGSILAGEDRRTSVPHIFAVGDCSEAIMLTPVAVRGGERVAQQLLGRKPHQQPADKIPTAIFTTPECASVGMTEEEADAAELEYDVRRKSFSPLVEAEDRSACDTIMKVLVEKESGRLVGFHFFGMNASEMIQLGAVALMADLTEGQLHQTMQLHPTVAEEIVGLGMPDSPMHSRPKSG